MLGKYEKNFNKCGKNLKQRIFKNCTVPTNFRIIIVKFNLVTKKYGKNLETFCGDFRKTQPINKL